MIRMGMFDFMPTKPSSVSRRIHGGIIGEGRRRGFLFLHRLDMYGLGKTFFEVETRVICIFEQIVSLSLTTISLYVIIHNYIHTYYAFVFRSDEASRHRNEED